MTEITIYRVSIKTAEGWRYALYFHKKTEAEKCFRRAKVKKLVPFWFVMSLKLKRNSLREAAAAAATEANVTTWSSEQWRMLVDREGERLKDDK